MQLKSMKQNNTEIKALIYVRVSDVKQKTEGHGLETQEHRCREYASLRGFEIEQIFSDDETGGGDYKKRDARSFRGLCIGQISKPSGSAEIFRK